MGRTVSYAPGYAPEDDGHDPLSDEYETTERTYLHFDRPLDEAARCGIRLTEKTVLANPFWPLLAFSKVERRVKRDKKSGAVHFKEKVREIKFCSHQDAALLERYTSWLALKYERYLSGRPFGGSILAYRRGVGSNILQAKSLFDEIRSRREVTALALDISGFFDNIRHSVLLENLKTLLNVDRLSAADYKVFRRLTRFEWVEATAIEERLKGRPRARGRICDAYQFRKFIRRPGESLVKVNCCYYGIPQGTPLSGLYANISLLDIDRRLHEHFDAIGATYRRYSDDIAIVLPEHLNAADEIDTVRTHLAEVGLSLSEAKTEVSRFTSSSGQLTSDKPLQYLGFTFDGQRILIRQSSLNRYYSKMKSGVLSKILAAHRNNVAASEIYMRELYRKYTHFGKHRNFPRYAYRAARDMSAPEIRAQISNHFEVFKEIVRMTVQAVY